MNLKSHPNKLFRLRPVKAAKVSKISETTAAAAVDPAERVNFHIGHPVSDERLISLYQQLSLGISLPETVISDRSTARIKTSHWPEEQSSQVQLLAAAIRQSIAYLPVGGFQQQSPPPLALHIRDWLCKNQEEPLSYHLGDQAVKREIIFTSGGATEALRVLLHSLNEYLVHKPARIFIAGQQLPDHLYRFKNLQFNPLPADENALLAVIEEQVTVETAHPNFLILNKLLSEKARRVLRRYAVHYPLFFIETNNAPNQLSLAREAGLSDRVLRLLTPTVFAPQLANIALGFIVGNADYLQVIENVHFKLKGTPSAAEAALLTHLLESDSLSADNSAKDTTSPDENYELMPNLSAIRSKYSPAIDHLVNNTTRVIRSVQNKIKRYHSHISALQSHTTHLSQKVQKAARYASQSSDPFAGLTAPEITALFFNSLDQPQTQQAFIDSFLHAFLDHYPEYTAHSCQVISGSARTALSLLGFHCGLRDVIVPDLSWTYDNCFPGITFVPLRDDLCLDVDKILQTIDEKLSRDDAWQTHGALILNNPHNATGQIFQEESCKRLLSVLLPRGIYVIDDLSYRDVAPGEQSPGLKTLKQSAVELQRKGYLKTTDLDYLITVQSLSKTNCFAGARLSVIEILHPELRRKFTQINQTLLSNQLAVLLGLLFYRNPPEKVKRFYRLRNIIFQERLQALLSARKALPAERNPYSLNIIPPQGSMYPRLQIGQLPDGITPDGLANNLARQGIGMVPLTTFARTAQGYDQARKAFRLTLGGSDNAPSMARKTRRVLIDLNRIIADQAAHYQRRKMSAHDKIILSPAQQSIIHTQWPTLCSDIKQHCHKAIRKLSKNFATAAGHDDDITAFFRNYFPRRMMIFQQALADRLSLIDHHLSEVNHSRQAEVMDILHRELYKEQLQQRKTKFHERLFDRTVHPTQMYALDTEIIADRIIQLTSQQQPVSQTVKKELAFALVAEYFGRNVPINSAGEAEELIVDLHTIIASETWAFYAHHTHLPLFLSFWGDWDGSTRPSGQGHRLVAGALIENVKQQAHFLRTLMQTSDQVQVDSEITGELNQLDRNIEKFWELLNQITALTNQLEKRYLRILPYEIKSNLLRKIGIRLQLLKDPMAALWQHNDRLERKMLKLRRQRRRQLQHYFYLNKRLRKTLYKNLPLVKQNLQQPQIAALAGFYRSLLRRFVLTPRIHQKMILDQDQFPIDTTIHNIIEINEIAGQYGNPGLVMALQISMSTDPEALIKLDRKIRSQRESVLRCNPQSNLPNIGLIPLFEDVEAIHSISDYLERIWDYAVQSRSIGQSVPERMANIIYEVFIAGSDLSQNEGQTAAAALYRQAKLNILTWLAAKGLVGQIRIKLGSGEPMQRQGGYYDPQAGLPAVAVTWQKETSHSDTLLPAARQSLKYAISPLRGILQGGEFRTFQSNLFEHLRRLALEQRTQVLYHVYRSVHFQEEVMRRAAEPLKDTRLQFQKKGQRELAMLTTGQEDAVFKEFSELATNNFRQILYGRDEDVVGIHAISYFISRGTPPLRDRPTVRPAQRTSKQRGAEIVERIAGTLPLSSHGSLLRAIGHNRSQTMILGINQLTTGLFRALGKFRQAHPNHAEQVTYIAERILPELPVFDLLHTLRIYHDPQLTHMREMESTFPAGNSALLALREDNDLIPEFLPYLQRELIRRLGLDPEEFFTGSQINPDVLPVFRPDLAVLLQPDLFNTDPDKLSSLIEIPIADEWRQKIEQLIKIPLTLRFWRQKIWQIIHDPIHQQVQSFVELSLAINRLVTGGEVTSIPFTREQSDILRLGSQITDLLRNVENDTMRQFLVDAVQYLTQLPKSMTQIPLDVMRALKDVQRIVKLEEQALPGKDQDLVRYYILQIARLCGENG